MNYHNYIKYTVVFIFHGHPGGTRKGAMALRQAIDAYMNKESLSEYAKTHPELREALDIWGSKTFK